MQMQYSKSGDVDRQMRRPVKLERVVHRSRGGLPSSFPPSYAKGHVPFHRRSTAPTTILAQATCLFLLRCLL